MLFGFFWIYIGMLKSVMGWGGGLGTKFPKKEIFSLSLAKTPLDTLEPLSQKLHI